MVRITLGRREERLKWNLLFFGIFLIVLLGSCLVCRQIDWSFRKSAFDQLLLEKESEIVLLPIGADAKARKLLGECHSALRSRWLTGYFYLEREKQHHFIGRLAPREFREAVLAQKEPIDSGKPFDTKKIPRFRTVVHFERLHCRVLVAEYEQPGM